jgi:hypothetical protein
MECSYDTEFRMIRDGGGLQQSAEENIWARERERVAKDNGENYMLRSSITYFFFLYFFTIYCYGDQIKVDVLGCYVARMVGTRNT